ncbi:MAG: HD domain-containing protein [Solirubrobacterales bacterium]|nr:HD domain-containing protein [Solirubrobacterales bacterium]
MDDPSAVESTVEDIVAACRSMVGLPYDGEPVDQLEHALQCAALARLHGDDEFVVAALLHDIARAPAVAGIPYDGPHEHHGATAARWLKPRVGARVAWLAEQHVAAKRYLVATDPGYADRLTEVSARTLTAQGGPMSPTEVQAFRSHRDWRLALMLRAIDDQGKVPGARVPGIDDYHGELRRVVAGHRGAAG